MEKSEFESMIAEAQVAFWQVISKRTGLRTGELDAFSEEDFDKACAQVVLEWMSNISGTVIEFNIIDL